MNLFWDASIW